MTAVPLLIAALREPQQFAGAAPSTWELLVRQARKADLLPRLAHLMDGMDLPEAARAHLQAASVVAEAQRDEVHRELAFLRQALAPTEAEPLLLKGAAYVAAQLPAGRARMFNDIDLMLPKPLLPQAEAQLMLHGWATTHHSAYDQRYYREWMHELPPMRHLQRHSVIDLHHAILPLTAKLKPDAAKLFAAAIPAPHALGFRVLAPTDMVLHSASHLTHNDECTHMLRDLVDIDLLLRDFGRRPGFWPALLARAVELDLARPLHYVLQHARSVLGTPVPQEVLQQARQQGAPGAWVGALMDAAWPRALRCTHPTMALPATRPALWLLYVRAHWLRMPPWLLTRHLTIKALGWHEARNSDR